VTIMMEDGTVETNGYLTLPIHLDNAEPVAGFQFTIRDWPNHVIATALEATDRLDGFDLLFNDQEDGSVIIAGYNLGGDTMPAGSDPIGHITYQGLAVSNQTEVTALFEGVLFGDSNAQEIPTEAINAQLIILPEEGIDLIPAGITLAPGTSGTMALDMVNEVPVAGFQFHINVDPEIVEILEVQTTPRTDGWAISIGWDNVIGFSFTGLQIDPGEGPIMTFTMNSLAEGETEFRLTDIILSDINGQMLPARSFPGLIISGMEVPGCTDPVALNFDPNATIDDGSCEYGLPGDINQDTILNVLDIVSQVGFIMGTLEPNPYQFWAGDLNGDEILNVLDVVLLVGLIMDL